MQLISSHPNLNCIIDTSICNPIEIIGMKTIRIKIHAIEILIAPPCLRYTQFYNNHAYLLQNNLEGT